MSVVIVGGNDCMVCRYKNICKKYSYKAKVFTQVPSDFKSKIGSPDVYKHGQSQYGTLRHKRSATQKRGSDPLPYEQRQRVDFHPGRTRGACGRLSCCIIVLCAII